MDLRVLLFKNPKSYSMFREKLPQRHPNRLRRNEAFYLQVSERQNKRELGIIFQTARGGAL
jgi:hypothetical protein